MKNCAYCKVKDNEKKIRLFNRFFHEDCFHSFIRITLTRQGFNITPKQSVKVSNLSEGGNQGILTVFEVVILEQIKLNHTNPRAITKALKMHKSSAVSAGLTRLRKKGIINRDRQNFEIINPDWVNVPIKDPQARITTNKTYKTYDKNLCLKSLL